jgi:hypothetical protein
MALQRVDQKSGSKHAESLDGVGACPSARGVAQSHIRKRIRVGYNDQLRLGMSLQCPHLDSHTAATLIFGPLGPIICGRSKLQIAERSQVFSPQMMDDPSGSKTSAATVRVMHTAQNAGCV